MVAGQLAWLSFHACNIVLLSSLLLSSSLGVKGAPSDGLPGTQDALCLRAQAAFTVNITRTINELVASGAQFPNTNLSTATAIGDLLAACTSSSESQPRARLRPINLLAMDAEYALWLADEYQKTTGWPVNVNVKYGNDDLDSYLAALQAGKTPDGVQYDAFIMRPDRLGAMNAANALMNLDELLSKPEAASFQWQDFYVNVRESVPRYAGKTLAVPLGVWPFMLYVRQDWMQEGMRLLGVPASQFDDYVRTHQGLLAVAEALQAKYSDFSLVPGTNNTKIMPNATFNDRVVCIHTAYSFYDSTPIGAAKGPMITHGAFLLHLMGTIMQTKGPSQGWLVDPDTGLPLVNTKGMNEVLKLWLRYMAITITQPVGQAAAYSCPIIFSSMEPFKNLTSYPPPVRSNIRIYPMPGSITYFDRGSGEMRPCTSTTCSSSASSGRTGQVLYYNAVGGSATRRSYLFGISSASPLAYQLQSWDLVQYLSTTTGKLAFTPDLDVSPIRTTDMTDQAAWLQQGWTYNEWEQYRFMNELSNLDFFNWMEEYRAKGCTDMIATIQTHLDSLYTSVAALANTTATNPANKGASNASSPARDRKLFQVFDTIQMPDGVNASQAGPLIASTMQDLYTSMMQLINSQPGGLQAFKADYADSLNRPSAPASSGAPGERTGSGDDGKSYFFLLSVPQRAAIIATPIALAVLLIALTVGGLMFWRKTQRRALIGGAILAPGPGPNTTLLVTDIENSTTFWEVMPPDVMDASIALHHLIIRTCARKFTCYESATEGDSFLLAAHTPADALRCALAVQEALMDAPWAPALLAHPLCQPRWSVPSDLPPGVRKLLSSPATASKPNGFSTVALEMSPQLPLATVSSVPSGRFQTLPLPVTLSEHLGDAEVALALMNDRLSAADVAHPWSLQEAYQLALVPPPGSDKHSRSTAGIDNSSTGARRRSILPMMTDQGAPGPVPGSVLVVRGLRVRMGCHTGVSDTSHVTFNKTAGRTQYSGEFLMLAKLIQDAAQGGQVLVSGSCFSQLPKEALQSEVVLGHMGRHLLQEEQPAVPVYTALNSMLLLRAGLLGPVRSISQTSPGCMQAPTCSASICFMTALGTSTLMAWDARVAKISVALYQQIAQELAWRMGGYVVEAAEGLMLVAFRQPTAALDWSTSTLDACLEAEWPEELLQHHLGEEISVTLDPIRPLDRHSTGNVTLTASVAALDSPADKAAAGIVPAEQGSPRAATKVEGIEAAGLPGQPLIINTRLFRGLRLKCGIDLGNVSVSLNATTGHLNYFGKVMNRAARICSVAKTGQVWCSETTWVMHHHAGGSKAALPKTGRQDWSGPASQDHPASYDRTGSTRTGIVVGDGQSASLVSSSTDTRPTTVSSSGPRPRMPSPTPGVPVTAVGTDPVDNASQAPAQPSRVSAAVAGASDSAPAPDVCSGADSSQGEQNLSDTYLSAVPLGPHKLKGIIEQLNLYQVKNNRG